MLAIVFPGQGSQAPGMGHSFFEGSPAAKEVFDRVSNAVGKDIASLCFDSTEEVLRQTQNAQIALYAVGLAAWSALSSGLKTPVGAMAGHSIGEYTALAASGSITIEQGAELVQRRGDLMARSGNLRPGGMAAVLGMDAANLDSVCKEASGRNGVVVVANDNSPGQVVISGDVLAVESAAALASEKGAKRVVMLNVSGAFHSPLMLEASEAMGIALNAVTFGAPKVPVYSNVTTLPIYDGGQWPSVLTSQLHSPVLWTQSVTNIIGDGARTFVECGSGEVLSGLIKRIAKTVELPVGESVGTLCVTDMDSLTRALEQLND